MIRRFVGVLAWSCALVAMLVTPVTDAFASINWAAYGATLGASEGVAAPLDPETFGLAAVAAAAVSTAIFNWQTISGAFNKVYGVGIQQDQQLWVDASNWAEQQASSLGWTTSASSSGSSPATLTSADVSALQTFANSEVSSLGYVAPSLTGISIPNTFPSDTYYPYGPSDFILYAPSSGSSSSDQTLTVTVEPNYSTTTLYYATGSTGYSWSTVSSGTGSLSYSWVVPASGGYLAVYGVGSGGYSSSFYSVEVQNGNTSPVLDLVDPTAGGVGAYAGAGSGLATTDPVVVQPPTISTQFASGSTVYMPAMVSSTVQSGSISAPYIAPSDNLVQGGKLIPGFIDSLGVDTSSQTGGVVAPSIGSIPAATDITGASANTAISSDLGVTASQVVAAPFDAVFNPFIKDFQNLLSPITTLMEDFGNGFSAGSVSCPVIDLPTGFSGAWYTVSGQSAINFCQWAPEIGTINSWIQWAVWGTATVVSVRRLYTMWERGQ